MDTTPAPEARETNRHRRRIEAALERLAAHIARLGIVLLKRMRIPERRAPPFAATA